MFRTMIVVVIAAAILLGLTVPTLALGWAPMLHSKCTTGARIDAEYSLLPAALVNSPFGGAANGTGLGDGTGSLNGTTAVVFFPVNLSVFALVNATVWGPGTNTRCSQPLVVIPSPPPANGLVGAGVPVPSNLSDVGEAITVNLSSYAGSPVVPIWDNGFQSANQASVSTCDSSAVHESVTARGAQLGIPYDDAGVIRDAPYTLPFPEQYTYFFPADFGTWAIDNLSAPGGPGGGWAFDFLGVCT